MRKCDNCGTKMAPGAPRKRVGADLLCAACVQSPRRGYVSAAKTAADDHEVYYHNTEDPHFAPDAAKVPHDNTFSMDERKKPGLFLTKDPNYWAQAYGYQRPYLAEVHVPKGLGGGERWGREHFVEGKDLHQVKVHRVMPLDEHIRENYGSPGRIESFHGTSHDGRELTRTGWGDKGFKEPLPKDYKYSGPDVRDMSPDQHRQHYERWRDFMVGGGNEGHQFGHNEFDDKKMTMSGEDHDSDYDDEGQFIMRDHQGKETGRKWAAKTPEHPSIVENRSLFGVSHTHGGRCLPVPLSAEAILDRDAQEARMGRRDWTKTKFHDPVANAVAGARAYNAKVGLGDPHNQDFHQVMTNANRIKSLGRAYDSLPDHHADAIPHFDQMKREVDQQFHHMTNTMGIKAEFVHHDPYANAGEMIHDVQANKRIQVMHTALTGSHPHFSDETNNRFRAVHDFFGHAATGRDFDEHGEEAAFQAHAKMFSKGALPALTSETRGQNGSLVLNGQFAPQKIALLPQHLWTPSDRGEHGLAAQATRKVAHDSGDGETIYHCPFCGSGQVIARSDKTIECEFCHTCFTVQVQPQYSAFPQTINGMPVQVPGMPGQLGQDPTGAGAPVPGGDPNNPAAPVDGDGDGAPDAQAPADDTEDEQASGGNPFTSGLRTSTGAVLDPVAYMRHLAIKHADDKQAVLARVKASRG